MVRRCFVFGAVLPLLMLVSCATWQQKYMRERKISPVGDNFENYLYEINYDCGAYDYQKAAMYFKKGADSVTFGKAEREKAKPFLASGCSTAVSGNFFGHSYDSYYDDSVEFVIKVNGDGVRHSSVGVAAGLPRLTDDFVRRGKYDTVYEILPFMTVDGINDAGVACAVNTVPVDIGGTQGTKPGKEDIFAPMLVRLVLDYASSAREAVDLVENRNVFTSVEGKFISDFHLMIADAETTYAIEFIDDKVEVMEGVPVMTNFLLSPIMNKYDMGKERYDILNRGFRTASSKRGMINLMKEVYYSKAYDLKTNPFWYSEAYTDWGRFAKPADFDADDFDLSAYYRAVRDGQRELGRRERASVADRAKAVWQTCHFSVYDMDSKSVTVVAQENNREFDYKL